MRDRLFTCGRAVWRACLVACVTSGAVAQETGLPVIPPDGVQGTAPATPPASPASQPAILVKEFRFTGGTAFTTDQLLQSPVVVEQVDDRVEVRTRIADYVGKALTAEGLEQIRQALTRTYINAGYINSGAVLPDQTIETGVVTYELVEGTLTDVNLTYLDSKDPSKPAKAKLRPRYVISRVKRGAKTPLNVYTLRNQLEVLRQNPNLSRVNAELRPGTKPGEAYVDVQVAEEPNPLQLGVQVSNRRSPSVGAEQVELLASHRNLTGNGDTLAVRYGLNTGGFEDWDWAGADDFSIDYSIPITPADTTLVVGYTRTDSLVVEEPFDDLDITSESNSIAVGLRHPFYRSPNVEFAMFAAQVYRDNQTELLGEPFSFSPGAEDGESVVAPLRFGQEFTARSQVDALAVRSTFSLGLPIFGATQNGNDVADGKYFAWLGQAQYVRRLNPKATNPLHDWQLVLRGSAQISADPLLSIEQFAVGGIDTVRGYRENQIVRDTGFAGTVELHIPIVATVSGNRILELVPFLDMGYGQNVNSPKNGEFLPSVGVGLVYTPNRHVTAQVYYGYALNRDVNDETDDLQDAGIHFNVLVLAF